MKKIILVILTALAISGCNPSFWGGTGAGAVGTGAGYEFNAKRQIDRLDKDLAAGKITQQEHDIRADQVKRDSLLQ